MKAELKTEATISIREYEDLIERSRILGALEEAGVDSWEGYSDAMELLGEVEDD